MRRFPLLTRTKQGVKDLWEHTYGCVIAWDFLYMTRILMTTLFMAASLSAVSGWQNKHRNYKAKASTKSPCVLSCAFGGLGFVDNAFIESLSSSVSELGFVMGNQANFGELALRDKNYWLNPVPKAWLRWSQEVRPFKLSVRDSHFRRVVGQTKRTIFIE